MDGWPEIKLHNSYCETQDTSCFEMSLISRMKSHIVISHKSKPLPYVRLFKDDGDTSSLYIPSFPPPTYKYRDIFLAVVHRQINLHNS